MKKLIIILLTLFSLSASAQIVPKVIKVQGVGGAKLQVSDTSSMLNPYLRKTELNIANNETGDSLIWTVAGVRHAIKVAATSSGGVTLSQVDSANNVVRSEIPEQFNPSATGALSLDGEYPNISFNMSPVLRPTDSASMLNPYLRKADAEASYVPLDYQQPLYFKSPIYYDPSDTTVKLKSDSIKVPLKYDSVYTNQLDSRSLVPKSYVDSINALKANSSAIPTNNNQLTNGSNFITSTTVQNSLDLKINYTDTLSKVITPYSIADFATPHSVPSTNLFLDNARYGHYWSTGNGSDLTNATQVSTPKIAVSPSTTYVMAGYGTSVAVVQFNSSGSYIGNATRIGITGGSKFTTDAACASIAINLSGTSQTGFDSSFQLNLGATLLPYMRGTATNGVKYSFKVDSVLKVAYSISVLKKGDSVYLRARYNDTADIVQIIRLHNLNNEASIGETYLVKQSDSTLATPLAVFINANDNSAPLQFSYLLDIDGGHGTNAISATVSGHGKTTADIGSVWSDGTYQYYLAEITDANTLVFASKSTSIDDPIRSSFNSTTLIHVSGAVHTTSMSISSSVSVAKYPVTYNNNQKLIVDGRVITEDGNYFANNFSIVERYNIVDPATYSPTVGSAFKWNDGSSLAEMNKTYKWDISGSLVLNNVIKFNQAHNLLNAGIIQVQTLPTTPDLTGRFYYIPGSKAITGYDFSGKQDMTSNPGSSIHLAKSDMTDSDKPSNRMIEGLETSGGITKVANAHGYNITFGSSKPSIRVSNLNSDVWYISTANKSYPRLANNVSTDGLILYADAYYTFFDPVVNDSMTAVYAVPNGKGYLLYLDANQDLTNYTVKVPQYLAGLSITSVESNSAMTLITDDVVPASGLILNNTGKGYLVLKLQ